MSAHAPESLGGFVLVDRLGKGGMGEVWRAERTGPGAVRRRAAVKRILPMYQREPLLRERFMAEARITARLEHPNICQLIDFGDAPELYLVLEYVEGTTVANLLHRAATGQGKLPPAAALFIIAEAASGLDYAHRRTDEEGHPLGIVHRDVSPGNILVSIDGAVKVSDFGVARAADNIIRTQAGLTVGKLVYMSPEQARGEVVDRRADIFALGIILWELLTLRQLIPRDSPADAIAALTSEHFAPPSSLVPGLPPAVDAIVLEALAVNPAARTPSASRLAKALRTALHGLSPGFDSRELSQVVLALVPELDMRDPREPVSSGSHPAAAAPGDVVTRLAATYGPPAAPGGLAPSHAPPPSQGVALQAPRVVPPTQKLMAPPPNAQPGPPAAPYAPPVDAQYPSGRHSHLASQPHGPPAGIDQGMVPTLMGAPAVQPPADWRPSAPSAPPHASPAWPLPTRPSAPNGLYNAMPPQGPVPPPSGMPMSTRLVVVALLTLVLLAAIALAYAVQTWDLLGAPSGSRNGRVAARAVLRGCSTVFLERSAKRREAD